MSRTNSTGTSLAKGPAGIVGLILLAYGVTALIFGDHSFTSDPVSGTVNGEGWLGLEVNGWSSLLTAGAGLLLLLAAPLHWGAKSIALIAGLALGAASVILLVDGSDVFGIFAGNGKTALAWGIAAAVLLIVGLLPRVGGKDKHDTRRRERDYDSAPDRVERTTRTERPVTRDAGDVGSARLGSRARGN